MAIAGTLSVAILAKTEKFRAGIGSARTSLKAFRKQIGTVGKGVMSFGSQLATVAGVGSIGLFAAKTIAAADSLGKVSNKLGIATADLELMRFAAERSGIAVNTMDMGLQRMVRRVGQAAQGTGEAVKTLDRLGLSAERLVKLDPAKQFKLIADALHTLPDRGTQLAGFMSIFDTEGVDLINIGAAGIERMANAFKEAGGATSAKGIENATKFSDSVLDLKKAIGATGRDFVLGVTPGVLKAVDGLRVIMDNLGISEEGTAKAKAAKERGGFGGLLGGARKLERLNRQLATNAMGELIALLGTNRRVIHPGTSTRPPRLAGAKTPREFIADVQHRAHLIRNSDASLRLQQKTLDALTEQTGIEVRAAEFN